MKAVTRDTHLTGTKTSLGSHNTIFRSIFSTLVLVATWPGVSEAAPGALSDAPLYVTNNVKHNIMLAIDDSGSMDSEVLFPNNDGALWWDPANKSFAGIDGALNFGAGLKKFVYLFPNGTGDGNRVYADSSGHFAIPPLPQYAFARSPDYNKAYFSPDVTYDPWVSYSGQTFSNITPTTAPSDPVRGSAVVDLTQNIESGLTDHMYKFYDGMVIPAGTYYRDGAAWATAVTDISITSEKTIGIRYTPAVYYRKDKTGAFSLASGTYNCKDPKTSLYSEFHKNPGAFSSGNVDALAPDGACLKKFTLAAATAEMQNFANWYSYYRKRHMAMRSGVGHSFNGMSGIRTGLFTINERKDVTMLDFDTQRDTFYSTLYGLVGSGGTPNREALKHAGDQFKRTDAGAPVTEVCQKCFTVLFTDGFSTTWDSGVGNQDDAKGAPYEDAYDSTMGDIAMKYYAENLRPDLLEGQVATSPGCTDASPDPELDCNKNIHMNTYTVGLGAKGTIFGGTHNTVGDAYATAPVWPDTNAARDPRQIDDLYHAAVNGRGEMLSAETPADIATRMRDVLADILAQTGSAASVTFNAGTLGANSAVYLSIFDSNRWSGDLLAYQLDPASGDVAQSTSWRAAARLDAKAPTDRYILTHNGSDGVPFVWSSVSGTSIANDLKTNPSGGQDNASEAQDRLNFLRGDRTHEGKKFRVRDSVLGDIVHAGPVFVGKPELNWPDTLPTGTKYSSFKSSKSNRKKVIYAGANDGMLHGFDANSGEELLAYIPGALYSTDMNDGLHYLTNPLYQHRFYVDLQPVVSDAYIKSSSGGSRGWKSILVGGLRAGGRGLFALDVTDPTKFTDSGTNAQDIVMWEFTSADDPDLGHSFSKPVIVPIKVGASTVKWYAMFGNGYEDGPDGSGVAQLFILDLEGSLDDGTWDLGTDYYKISTGAGGTGDRNGLASPGVVDLDSDGAADRAYAGDLQGKLWAFDLSSTTPSKWGIADHKGKKAPIPLFTAGSNQAITTAPQVIKHPTEDDAANNQPNVLLFFGTGQYLTEGDKSNSSQQSFYGVWDSGSKGLTPSNLEEQTFVSGFPEDVRVNTDTAVSYSNTDGWYIDLPTTRERVVTDAVVRGDIVYFNTMIPDSKACSYGGTGWQMSVKLINGGRPSEPVFDYNNDDRINDDDKVADSGGDEEPPSGKKFTRGLPTSPNFLGDKRYTPGTKTGSGDEIEVDEVESLSSDVGRFSWQELFPK